MLRNKRLTKYLLDEIDADINYKTIKFFRSKSLLGYKSWLLLIQYYYSKNELDLETIIKSNKQSSRRSVVDFINLAKNLKYINTKKSKKDLRKKNYIPSEITINEFEKWSDDFFREIKNCYSKK